MALARPPKKHQPRDRAIRFSTQSTITYDTLMNTSRRRLLRASAGWASAGFAGCQATPTGTSPFPSMLTSGDTVLFQGDSITDSGRNREIRGASHDQAALGKGYAWLAAASMLSKSADRRLSIHNRGVSGNKVHQLDARWDVDCIDLRPDVLSILIGVNDVWHTRNGKYDGSVELFEQGYNALLTRTVRALPEVRLVVCEPFVLLCGAVDESWQPEMTAYRAAARRVADAHRAAWVPFHSMFEQASKLAPPETWAKDGVHPTEAGSALMAQEWLRVVDR